MIMIGLKKGLVIIIFLTGIVLFSYGVYKVIYASSLQLHRPFRMSHEYYVVDENNMRVAFMNVTLETQDALLMNNPINVTIIVRGLYVREGDWIYAYLDGATAASPEKEPENFGYSIPNVIVLSKCGFLEYCGSRVMKYKQGIWDIVLLVNQATIFIVHNIPQNPTNLPQQIYFVPKVIQIGGAEEALQVQAAQESIRQGIRNEGWGYMSLGASIIISIVIKSLK